MRILVTGGAGYIGSHACKALAAKGFEPIAFDNLSRGNRWAVKWGPLEQGDIADAREAIGRDGGYIENRLGEIKRHPAYATLREATAESRRWAAELGITPASRSRAGVHEDSDDGDDNPLAVE